MLHADSAQFLRPAPAQPKSAAPGYVTAATSLSFFAAASAIPYFAPQLAGFASLVLLYLLLGSGLALEIWLAGVPDFAFPVWFAIGAGCEAIVTGTFALPFWTGLPVAMVLTAALAVCVLAPLLRMRNEHVAVITLAFGAVVQILWSQSGFALPAETIPGASGNLLYLCVAGMAALAGLVAWRIRRSALALMLRAANEDEIASRAVGVDARRCRIVIVAIGAMFAGAAGCLFAAGQGSLRPADFDLSLMAVLLVIAVAGRRSQLNMILAAILATVLWQYLPAAPALRLLIAGAALLSWPLLRSIAISTPRDVAARDAGQTEAAIEAAAE